MVLELLPLSRDEILNAVQAIVPDPVLFLVKQNQRGSESYLEPSNP